MNTPRYSKPSKEELRALIDSAPKTPDERYTVAISDLSQSSDEYNRWCSLGTAAKACIETNRIHEAVEYSDELESLMNSYPEDWNFGNAHQDIHIVKGIVALRDGDIELAQSHLLSAGKSPGSPQMNSFGPNLTLAFELLSAGIDNVVLDYLELCRSFWKHDRGRIDTWSTEIKAGRIPDFGPNLIY